MTGSGEQAEHSTAEAAIAELRQERDRWRLAAIVADDMASKYRAELNGGTAEERVEYGIELTAPDGSVNVQDRSTLRAALDSASCINDPTPGKWSARAVCRAVRTGPWEVVEASDA